MLQNVINCTATIGQIYIMIVTTHNNYHALTLVFSGLATAFLVATISQWQYNIDKDKQ